MAGLLVIGFEVWGIEFRVQGLSRSGFRVSGFGFDWLQGLGFKGLGMGFSADVGFRAVESVFDGKGKDPSS